MYNKDLAEWLNNGEITMEEYLRIAFARDEKARLALANYELPTKAYKGEIDADLTIGSPQYWETYSPTESD